MKFLSTTSSFGKESQEPIDLLNQKNIELIQNPFARKVTENELIELLESHKPAALIAGTEKISRETLQEAKSYLKVISRVGVGWDSVDRSSAEEFGIQVFRTPDAVTPAVVELTIALFFNLARKISLQDRQIRQGQWKKTMGGLIQGKTLGVIGCGRIGKGVALSFKALGCNVKAYDPYADQQWHQKNSIELVDSIDHLIKQVDLLSIHTSYSPDMENLINLSLLNQARSNLLLVNVARGEVIHEEDLYQALKSGLIAGAGLDVFQKEPYEGKLTELDNVILTPHIGSYAKEARIAMETQAIENALKGLE